MEAKIHIIPTFHHDIAYLRPESWYRDRAFTILDKAVSIMEEDKSYTYTVEQVYFFRDYYNNRPELREKLKNFIQNGQLHFAPGYWVVPDMSMPSGESLYMQAILGRKYLSEQFGYTPRSAFIADCWGHHAQLPQIISQSGYDYYVFSRCMYESFDIENYTWRGLDGTLLPTHWMSSAYAGIAFPDNVAAVNAQELHWEQASREGFMKLYEHNRAHCGGELQIIPAGGDMRMPAASAPAIVRQLQSESDMVPLEFSNFDRALDRIDFTSKPEYAGEFISTFQGSFVTNIDIKIRNKQLENMIYSLELLSVLRGAKTDFTPQWETVLKNQFHDIICGTVCDEALDQARAENTEVLETLDNIRRKLSVGGRAAYFNPNNFAVSEIVDIDGKAYKLEADAFGIADKKELAEVPATLPCTYENKYYSVKINQRGYIASLIEKSSGNELVGTSDIPFGSLQMQADNGDNWCEFEYPCEKDPQIYAINNPDPYDRAALPTHPKAMISADGVRAAKAYKLGDNCLRIVQSGVLNYWASNIPFTVTLTLNSDSPRIEYHTEIDCQTTRVRVRAAFPSFKDGCIRHQIPYGIIERGEGAQPAQMFMDNSMSNAGLALMNRGLPHNNTEDGIMMLALFRSVAMEYKCQSVKSYCLGEHFAFDYAICPHGKDADKLLWEQALSFNRPLIESSDTPLQSFKIDGAYISALRYTDIGIFLRVFNGTDEASECQICVPDGYTRYALTDGCMTPVHEFDDIPSDVLKLTLKPYAVQGIMFI